METISSVPSEVMEDFLSIQPSVGCIIEKDLNKHFTKIENIEGSILEDFLKTSITLANSGVVVDDYGCYTFGIMKALDGLISKRILEIMAHILKKEVMVTFIFQKMWELTTISPR